MKPELFADSAYGRVYLNGRPALDWEIPALEHARKCELARDLEQLAGLLTEYRRPDPDGRRPVTDVAPLR